MSCIRTVLIAAGVSFVIILPFVWFAYLAVVESNINLPINVLIAVISAVAAIASACAASAANSISKQIQGSDKIRRTIDLSPYNSERFIEAWECLNEELEVVRNYKASKFEPILWEDKDGLFFIKHKSGPKLKRKFLIVLNFWGRIATANNEGLLEVRITKELYKYGFIRFVDLASNYLKTDTNKDIYKNTLELYEKWKSNETSLRGETRRSNPELE